MSTQHPADLPPLPERDGKLTNRAQGAYRKFDVRRTDGSDQPGGKHHGCEYFVLDVTHDPHAKAALQAYADACENTHMLLAADMRDRYGLSNAQAQPSLTDERAAFEKVIAKDCGDLSTFGTGANMHYKNSHVESEWIGWKRRAAIATQAAQPEQAAFDKERTARQEAQRELERFKGLLAAARVDLMRELKEQGWVQAQGVPVGWKLVPAEPTEAMFTALSHQIDEGVIFIGGFLPAYRCMLDAAPAAPQQAQGVPMCSEQAVMHALSMARDESPIGNPKALYMAFGRAMWRQFNAMAAAPQQAEPLVDAQISGGEFEANTKYMDLADRIDHEQNWRKSGICQRDNLTKDQQDRVLAGVILRRYAVLMAPSSWRLFPPRGGISFRASSLDSVIEMARKDEAARGTKGAK